MNRIKLISLKERLGVAADSVEDAESLKARWREQQGSRRRGRGGEEIASESRGMRPIGRSQS